MCLKRQQHMLAVVVKSMETRVLGVCAHCTAVLAAVGRTNRVRGQLFVGEKEVGIRRSSFPLLPSIPSWVRSAISLLSFTRSPRLPTRVSLFPLNFQGGGAKCAMLRRAWKPIAGTLVGIGAPASLYYYYSNVKSSTFNLQVKETGPDGKRFMTTRTFEMLSTEQVEKRLKDGAIVQSTARPRGLVWKRATASLASNNPIEDASASAIVERDRTETGPEGDLLFFAIMDGHVSPSRMLSIPCR